MEAKIKLKFISKSLLVCLILFTLPAGCASVTAAQYIEQGDKLQKEGRFDEAVDQYTQAIHHDGNLAEAYHKRAGAYIGQSQFLLAIADSTKSIQIDPNAHQPYQIRGMAYLLLSQYEKSTADLLKVLELTTDPVIIDSVNSILDMPKPTD